MCHGQVRWYIISFTVIHPTPWKTLEFALFVHIDPYENRLITVANLVNVTQYHWQIGFSGENDNWLVVETYPSETY